MSSRFPSSASSSQSHFSPVGSVFVSVFFSEDFRFPPSSFFSCRRSSFAWALSITRSRFYKLNVSITRPKTANKWPKMTLQKTTVCIGRSDLMKRSQLFLSVISGNYDGGVILFCLLLDLPRPPV